MLVKTFRKLIPYDPPVIFTYQKNYLKQVAKYLLSFGYQLWGHLLLLVCRPRKVSDWKYKVTICAIFRNEALFLREWIEYHRVIGVAHFYLYNNLSDDQYRDILQPYVEQGLVDLIDWPGRYAQLSAYEDCYKRFAGEAEWIGYIDLDEFVCPLYENDLARWLRPYRRYPSVCLYWRLFGTSGYLRHNPRKYVIEQYTSAWPLPTDIGKSFINTRFDFPRFDSPHYFCSRLRWMGMNFKLYPINEFKYFIVYLVHYLPLFRCRHTMQVNHYWSKAYRSYFYKDRVRGSAYSSESQAIREEMFEERFKYHENKNIVEDHAIRRFLVFIKLQAENEREKL